MPIIGVEEKFPEFVVTGVRPEANEPLDAFEDIMSDSFPDMWKIVAFYPKDFTFICPTEIVGFNNLADDFADRNAVVMMGNTDNEYCKVAWKGSHPDLNNLKIWLFADNGRGEQMPLSHQVGAFDYSRGSVRRAVFIVDPAGWVQWSAVYNDSVGRNPDEVLRVLDALQTGENCGCNRQIGEDTLM